MSTIGQRNPPDCSSLGVSRVMVGGKLDSVGLVFDTSILAD
jgi:hypothetical protein